ncbi:probable receptor-like protein kinase At1g49730 [Andrographis paniculata]|uniref:probable receptor-like protein kinase At1g49730 n=1 Tax=Andrographis paniculata TaxID=175694 RepID=UPI0021E7CBA5|nr:probable receptor-like protein kinase At1g49730 [Andrographis paniculata]XP_051146559.1 probable receptor-like protein kinase At1g49730 [Andrographis paniculata]XP_051146560.1 probable receptor-like protein kinase At1g49730 [Andrographis paniculata]
MEMYGPPAAARMVLVLVVFLGTQLCLTMAALDCPLDLSRANFTLAASLCSSQASRGKCCRYINALVAVSVSQYANTTSNLGVPLNTNDICLHTVSRTFELYGVTGNATIFCGFGTKIPVNYACQWRSTVAQMIQSPKFDDVAENCRVPLSQNNACRKCLNAGILYLRNLLGPVDNVTLSTCRDATFAALASKLDYPSTMDLAGCFFGVQGLINSTDSFPSSPSPGASPGAPAAASPTQLSLVVPLKENRRRYHLGLVPSVGIAVTVLALSLLAVLIFLIRAKRKKLKDADIGDKTTSPAVTLHTKKFQDGPPCLFRKFSYKEVKKGTNNFGALVGRGGFGVVYRAEFRDGLVAAVKRMSKASEQAEDDFCRELELLARLHHRHLVSLRGFCIERHERFLIYEYMANGSLKDHLHAQGRTPLSWGTRIQIAIDVANALEYLHLYCDPPLCHRDIKSSNILLDENFVAKVADFGLAHASKDGSICFEPVNTDIRGTPGYLDPEYVITQELTEKSDVYSYGIVLLELITGRQAIENKKNLVEWSEEFLASEYRITELVDPYLGDGYDFDQLQTALAIVRWCTQREGRARPSIKQVLRLLYESSDPLHSGFVEAIEDEEIEESRGRKSRGKNTYFSGDGRCLASSSSTSRSHCSRSFLLETGSPVSPGNVPSI